jgi:undecaprenyl pyrophosphate phosphatase UppP
VGGERDDVEPTRDETRGERAAHAIYGLIVVLAVMVVEADTTITARQAIGTVIGAATITAVAELYADYIGATIRAHRHLTKPERDTEIRNIAAGFLTALLPAGFFVLALLDAISLQAAFDAAIWTGVGLLGAYAVVANRLAGLSPGRSLLIGLAFTMLGAGLVVLKAVL